MSEVAQGSERPFFGKHWEGFKDFWGERFSFLNNYSRFLDPENPLPHWDSSVVEKFISADRIYGPTLKAAREAGQFGAAGALMGAVSTAGLAWKWSRSPHGALLSFGFGAVVGGTFGIEVANHWYQLYRMDTMAAQVKFMEWLLQQRDA